MLFFFCITEGNSKGVIEMAENQNLKMDDFKVELDASFRNIKEGDLLKGTIIGVSETGLIIDLGYYTEGFVPASEVSNNPHFSIRTIATGDEITAIVLQADSDDGYITLSLKQASDLLAWDHLKELMENKTIVTVKVADAVNAGVVAYLNDVRGFIPASLLSMSYVNDVNEYVGKQLDVLVTTVDPEKKKLILSAKEVERERLTRERNFRISELQKGLITKGTVVNIAPYGAFISIGEGLSGLVHISQICGKRIKSPNEVLKLGDEVTVKIMDVKDGKISLSMTAVKEEQENDIVDDVTEVPFSYSTGESATTGLGDLLKNFKF